MVEQPPACLYCCRVDYASWKYTLRVYHTEADSAGTERNS